MVNAKKDLELINEAIDEYNLHLEFLGDLLPILDTYYKGAVGFAMEHVIEQRDELIKQRDVLKQKWLSHIFTVSYCLVP